MDHNITIALVGDIMLGRNFRKLDRAHKPFSDDIVQIFRNADIVTGNLETTITNTSNGEQGKKFLFRMNPEHIHWLQNFDYLSIANNHILDYGYNGMIDTINYLDSEQIIYTGAGKNITEATQLKILILGKQKIGFISATDHYDYWRATHTQYGVNYIIPNLNSNFLQYVKLSSSKVDHLIIYLHWGPNYLSGRTSIPIWMQKYAHRLIDNGARIIAGTSPHHILPIERYKNGVIFYSLGDFIDDYSIDPVYRNDIGMIGTVTLTNNHISSLDITLTIIDNQKVSIL